MTIEYKDSKRIVALSSDYIGTSGWTTSNSSSIGISGNEITIQERNGDYDEVAYKSFTALGADASFTFRFPIKITTIDQTGGTDSIRVVMGVSSASDIADSTARDEVGIIWRVTDTINKFYAFTADGTGLTSHYSGTDFATTPSTTGGDGNGNYYVEISGSGGTYTFKLFSDSTYDTLIESESITDAGITGLQYYVFRTWELTTHSNQARATVTISNKPTDVQDNSILVEKDTANRYWFTPNTVDTEQAFSFTTTDTVGALYGNRIYGMKLLSGHSGLNKYIKKAKTYFPTNPTGSRLTTGTLYHVILDSSGTEIARSAGVSASSVSNNSWAETTFSSAVKLEENYTVGATISTGDANTYLGIGVNNNSSSPTNTTRYYKDQSGNESTSTSESILTVFDSDPATGISIPSTWKDDMTGVTGALTLDNWAGETVQTTATTRTFSYTITASAKEKKMLVVMITGGGSTLTVTSVTYAGQALTFLQKASSGSYNEDMEIWYMLNPPTGTADISATQSGSTNMSIRSCLSVYGVKQSAPLHSMTGGVLPISNGVTSAITPTVAGSWVFSSLTGSSPTNSTNDPPSTYYTNAELTILNSDTSVTKKKYGLKKTPTIGSSNSVQMYFKHGANNNNQPVTLGVVVLEPLE